MVLLLFILAWTGSGSWLGWIGEFGSGRNSMVSREWKGAWAGQIVCCMNIDTVQLKRNSVYDTLLLP